MHQIDLDDLYTVPEFAQRHARILNTNTLRYQLRDRETNGLASATVKIGKKLLISESGYRQWLAAAQARHGIGAEAAEVRAA